MNRETISMMAYGDKYCHAEPVEAWIRLRNQPSTPPAAYNFIAGQASAG